MLKLTLWSTNALYKSTLTSFDGKSKKRNCYGGIKQQSASRPGNSFWVVGQGVRWNSTSCTSRKKIEGLAPRMGP